MNMRKYLILAVLFVSCFLSSYSQIVWNGLGATNDWSEGANWVGGIAPGSADDVLFDGTSAKMCLIDSDIDINSLTISGYNGLLDGNTISNIITISSDFIQTSGTFISTDGVVQISGNMTNSGGSFIHNSGIVSFFLANGATSTISGAITFNHIDITVPTPVSGATQRNFNFGSGSITSTLTLNGSSRLFGYQGSISITDKLDIKGSNASVPANNTATFILNGSNAIIASSSAAGRNLLPNITINTSGNLSMSGNISMRSGTWLFSNVGSFTSGSSIANFYGTSNITSGTTASTRGYFDHITVATGAVLNLTGTSQVSMTGDLTHNGTFNSNSSLVILSGSAAQNITGSSTLTSFNALQIANTGNKSLVHATNVLDSIKISSAGVLVTGGNLTLKSTSSLKGRIASITGGGSISGNVRVETFIPGSVTDWAVLGVSGVNAQTMNNWYGAIPMAIEGSPTGVTSVSGNYFESVQGWKESDAYGYDTTMTISTALTPGKGFWVYTGTGLATTSDITTTVVGTPVTGNVIIGLTNSAQSGFNLIANPYASPISWAKLRNGNAAVNNAIYIYNADLGLTTSYVNGVSTPAASSANDVIPMGQGFYVQATGATNLTAQESNKIPSNTGSNQLLKSENSSSLFGDVIRLNVVGGGYTDDAAIRFHSSATSSFDTEWDAHKLYTSPGYVGYPGVWTKRTVIATQSNNEDFSVNSLPPATIQNAVIPVVVRVYTSGQYTISGSDLQNINPSACILLKDKVTNIIHDLRTGDYVCNINDTTYAARFELTICAVASTPTSIKSVTKPLNNSVYIGKDARGVFTTLNFDKATNATISVTNILGQKIIDNKKVNVSKETVYLDINSNEQLIFVTVETENEKVTKKFLNYN